MGRLVYLPNMNGWFLCFPWIRPMGFTPQKKNAVCRNPQDAAACAVRRNGSPACIFASIVPHRLASGVFCRISGGYQEAQLDGTFDKLGSPGGVGWNVKCTNLSHTYIKMNLYESVPSWLWVSTNICQGNVSGIASWSQGLFGGIWDGQKQISDQCQAVESGNWTCDVTDLQCTFISIMSCCQCISDWCLLFRIRVVSEWCRMVCSKCMSFSCFLCHLHVNCMYDHLLWYVCSI